MSKSKHKHEDSPFSVSGQGNTLNQGSFCNLEMELIMRFRNLSFEDKVEALNCLVRLGNGDKNMRKGISTNNNKS